MNKICVCGHSEKFPLCDNSHEEENWNCNQAGVQIGFCSSYRYENLALKLASHYQGVACLTGSTCPPLEKLFAIIDPMDLGSVLEKIAQIQTQKRIVIVIGPHKNLLQSLFIRDKVVAFENDNPLKAFRFIRKVVEQKDISPLEEKQAALKSAFISHAVKDEPLVIPTIEYLRKYFKADLFNCADSIAPGNNWQPEIINALKEKELFLFLISKASLNSHFCSFEIGMAYALNKEIMLLSLDGSIPPAFIQHIQTINIARIKKQKPWFETQDILMDELLKILSLHN